MAVSVNSAVSPAGFRVAGPTYATPSTSASAVPTASADREQVAVRGALDGQQHGCGVPGAEAVGEQVVGLTGGQGGRVVAGVGEAEADAQERSRQGQQHGQRADGCPPGAALDEPAPAVPARRVVRTDAPAHERHVQTLDVAAGEAEDGREQRHRRRHHDQDGEHHGEGEPVHGRLTHQQDAEHGDDHGHAGEEHGAAGGRDRGLRRPAGILAVGQAAAEPGDDQQRVVDADADADHGRGVRRPLRDVDDAPQHLAERHRDAEAEQRRDERQAHGDHRAEGDQQDDGRRDQADALGARGNGLGLGRDRAADLDLQRVVTGREDGRDQRRGLVGSELVGRLVEGDVGVGRRAVRRDLAGAVRGERAGDAHDVLRVGDIGEDRLDARPAPPAWSRRHRSGRRPGSCRPTSAGSGP